MSRYGVKLILVAAVKIRGCPWRRWGVGERSDIVWRSTLGPADLTTTTRLQLNITLPRAEPFRLEKLVIFATLYPRAENL